jgi:hypothetical protein
LHGQPRDLLLPAAHPVLRRNKQDCNSRLSRICVD